MLLNDPVLLGFELENGEFEDARKQFMVRKPTVDHFRELWEHGRKHCSKFTIYLKCGNLFVERRPDMLNYDYKDDCMYCSDDLKVGGLQYNQDVMKSLRYTETDFDNSMRIYKIGMMRRIRWALEHFIEIRECTGGANIIFEE